MNRLLEQAAALYEINSVVTLNSSPFYLKLDRRRGYNLQDSEECKNSQYSINWESIEGQTWVDFGAFDIRLQ